MRFSEIVKKSSKFQTSLEQQRRNSTYRTVRFGTKTKGTCINFYDSTNNKEEHSLEHMSTKDQNSRHVTNKVSQRGVGSEKEVVNMKPALRVHTGAKPSCSQLYFITKG